MFALIGFGIYKGITGGWSPIAPVVAGFGFGDGSFRKLTSSVTLFYVLKGFASG